MYRKRVGRVISLAVVVLLALGLLLAGCDSAKESEPAKETTAASQEKVTEAAAAEATEAAEEEAQLEHVDLKWYIAGKAEPDIDAVAEAMSGILEEKINASIEIINNPWGDHAQKIPVKIASGEPFDLCFTSNWCFNYAQNASKGSFVEMDALIAQYAQEAYDAIPEKMWNTVKINGKIYGFINNQIAAVQPCFTVVKKYLDKYEISQDSLKTLADLEPLLMQVKDNEMDILPLFGTGVNPPFNYVKDFEEFAGDYMPGAVMKGDTTMTAVNPWEVSTGLMEQLELARRWYELGIFPSDIAVLKDQNAWTTVGKICAFVQQTKPGAEVENAALLGMEPGDVIDIEYGNAYLSATACQATLNAISNTSLNPERTMMFINLMNTDKVLYNTMCFGVEGTHYTMLSDNTVEAIDDSGYNPNRDWEFGNQFNAYFRSGQSEDVWTLTAKMNEEAEASPLLGFSFDQEPVKTEIAQCEAILAEYKPLLLTGTVDPQEKLPEMLGKLEAAGSEKIVAELQRQIDLFAASN